MGFVFKASIQMSFFRFSDFVSLASARAVTRAAIDFDPSKHFGWAFERERKGSLLSRLQSKYFPSVSRFRVMC